MKKKYEDGKYRMIHIRLTEELHKRLRVRAAEEDSTIQDWVQARIEKALIKGAKR